MRGRATTNPAKPTASASQPVAGASHEIDVPSAQTDTVSPNPTGSSSTPDSALPLTRATSKPLPAQTTTSTNGNRSQAERNDPVIEERRRARPGSFGAPLRDRLAYRSWVTPAEPTGAVVQGSLPVWQGV